MKKFYCPVNGWDCPSWRDDGSCKLVDKGKDPTLECSDAFTFWEEDAGHGCYFANLSPLTSDLSPLIACQYADRQPHS